MVDSESHHFKRNRLDPEDAGEALERVESLLRLWEELPEELDRDALLSHPRYRQQVGELAAELDALHPADVAYILDALAPAQRLIVWELVRAEHDGEILLEVSDPVREALIASMDKAELVAAAETLEADEIADLAPDLPEDVMNTVRQGLTIEEREQLRAAMSYPAHSVGARMDFEMLSVRGDITLEVVLRYLRRWDKLPEQTDQIFVVDRDDTLIGALPIHRLLVNELDVNVQDLIDTEILTLSPSDEASEAAQAFERYDLVSAPVVDTQGKLTGRLTVNEAMDVIREISEEQALSAAGLREEENIFAPIVDSVKNRGPWILTNLCTASMAAFVASRFEQTVGQIVILAFLMSIVAGIAGNSGVQTMTLIIRALALGQITAGNVRSLIRKELAVAILIGCSGGLIAGMFAWAISKRLTLGLVMMAAMLLNLLMGAAVGMLVPLVRAKFGKDPAIGSSVMLTFVTDTFGFFIFLELATLFLL